MNPQLYSRNVGPLLNLTRILFEKHGKLLKWKTESEAILDVGVGDGTIARDVFLPSTPENLKEYVGSDISEAMLKRAKDIVLHPKFSTINLDITNKNVPQQLLNRFHHIFVNLVLHALNDPR